MISWMALAHARLGNRDRIRHGNGASHGPAHIRVALALLVR
jgi:hypothetical protein